MRHPARAAQTSDAMIMNFFAKVLRRFLFYLSPMPFPLYSVAYIFQVFLLGD